ncbi:MAG: HD-GYP domain-containing protein [Porticoccaceae bacterium]
MTTSAYDKIAAQHLRIGMYVVELDRPWLDTPFLVQGFVIRTLEQLETLKKLCDHVYIDSGRSLRFAPGAGQPAPGAGANPLSRERLQRMFRTRVEPYRDSAPFNDEVATARNIYDDYEQMVVRLYDDVRSRQKINIREINHTIADIVDSVTRNPDACMRLAKLRRKGDYTYNHAIGSSIWAAALGRQLGLPKRTIQSIATGALLSDVGKVALSDRLLNKAGALTEEEIAIARSHVDKGLALLAETRGVDAIARQMLETHHERHSGKGYPRGLRGAQIPVYGRIAAIVDTYDALINDKPYRKGMAASEAVKLLYQVRGEDFQAELVEEFIQAVGIYPAGSLVELSNGEVGVVVTEHRRRRLRPKLLMLLDADKARLDERRFVDLFEVTHDSAGAPLDIRRGLTPDEYGIDPDDIFV